jgi:tetratricopeptide (TPR) repeat protein
MKKLFVDLIVRNPSAMLLIIGVFLFHSSFTQEDELSAKAHAKLGEELFDRGEYAEAADHLYSAWSFKKKKEEWLYGAGLSYEYIQDYKNAAKAFEQLKESKKYKDSRLKYAHMLKQTGQYQMASKEFLDYIYEYDEDDKNVVERKVQNEIRGCELGIQLIETGNISGLELETLGKNVNTPKDEFNPIPFDKNILYYASDFGGDSKFYRTTNENGNWQAGIIPPLFPDVTGMNISNGAFSPDFKRFFFNKCEENGDGLTTDKKCELYYIKKEGESWSKPIRMKDYINVQGTSNAHPFVVYTGDKEVVYFSSDRSGGRGGMDLWYIVRDRSSNITEYTFPTNLGKSINTEGDEIAPFYSLTEGNLYFSSNGRAGMGGFDIYRSKGSEAFWENAENAGLPFNSPAEDFQFTMSSDGSRGYLVSNRPFVGIKNSSTDYDIYSFETGFVAGDIVLKGSIFDDEKKTRLKNVEVILLEDIGGSFKKAGEELSSEGSFLFKLEEDRSYRLMASKEGYVSSQSQFNTSGMGGAVEFEQNLFLIQGVASVDQLPQGAEVRPQDEQKRKMEEVNQPVVQNKSVNDKKATDKQEDQTRTNTEKKDEVLASERVEKRQKLEEEVIPVDEKTVKITQPVRTNQSSIDQGNGRIVDAVPVDRKRAAIVTDGNGNPIRTSSKSNPYPIDESNLSGLYYKVQICSVSSFDANNPAFDKVRSLGNLDTEFLPTRGMTRVLLGSYSDRSDVEQVVTRAQKGGFPSAFIVEYKDGQRLNQ